MELAHKWQFEGMMLAAFNQYIVQNADYPINILEMRFKYHLDHTLALKAYQSVRSRAGALNFWEGRRVGWESCCIIGQLRDKHTPRVPVKTAEVLGEFQRLKINSEDDSDNND